MYCPVCGGENLDNAGHCGQCHAPLPRIGVDPFGEMAGLLPVKTSLWAIAAGYLGLFSLIIFPGPLAVIVSIIAVFHLSKNPGLRGHVRAGIGLLLGVPATFVLLIVVLNMLNP